jgi:hypothetical protein
LKLTELHKRVFFQVIPRDLKLFPSHFEILRDICERRGYKPKARKLFLLKPTVQFHLRPIKQQLRIYNSFLKYNLSHCHNLHMHVKCYIDLFNTFIFMQYFYLFRAYRTKCPWNIFLDLFFIYARKCE